MTQIGMNAQLYAALVGLGGSLSTVIWGLQKAPLKLGESSVMWVKGAGDFLQNIALVNLVAFPMFYRILQAEAPWPLRLTTSLPLIVTWIGAIFYIGYLPAEASARKSAFPAQDASPHQVHSNSNPLRSSPLYQSFNTLIKCCNVGVLYFVALHPRQLDSITAFSLMGLALLSTASTFSVNRWAIKSAMGAFFRVESQNH